LFHLELQKTIQSLRCETREQLMAKVQEVSAAAGFPLRKQSVYVLNCSRGATTKVRAKHVNVDSQRARQSACTNCTYRVNFTKDKEPEASAAARIIGAPAVDGPRLWLAVPSYEHNHPPRGVPHVTVPPEVAERIAEMANRRTSHASIMATIHKETGIKYSPRTIKRVIARSRPVRPAHIRYCKCGRVVLTSRRGRRPLRTPSSSRR